MKKKKKYFQICILFFFLLGFTVNTNIKELKKEKPADYIKIEEILTQAYKDAGKFIRKRVNIQDENSLLRELDKFELYCYKMNHTDQENVTYRKIREEIVSYKGGANSKSCIKRYRYSLGNGRIYPELSFGRL